LGLKKKCAKEEKNGEGAEPYKIKNTEILKEKTRYGKSGGQKNVGI